MRGGDHPKSKFKTGYQALIDAIWHKHGSLSTVADKLNEDMQDLINWRNRGKVPLQECPRIASSLGIPIWGLNYEQLKRFHSDQAPSWEETVKMYKFNEIVEKKILRLPI